MIKNVDPFIISEIGINHNGKLKDAFKLIDSSIRAGASAVKFQTYKTENRVKKNSKIFNILKQCELSFEDFKKIKKYCDKKNIIFFSTPFDVESVFFLKDIGVKLIKVDSFDITNFEIFRAISKTKLATIISTGILKKIDNAYKFFKSRKLNFSFLHCVSNYPNKEETSYLSCTVILGKNTIVQLVYPIIQMISTSVYGFLISLLKAFCSKFKF